MPPKLGILAGWGSLPGQLVAACQASGRDYFVIGFNGETDRQDLEPDAWVDVAAVGRTLGLLREAGCREVVLAGPIRRPSLTSLRPDRRGAKLMVKLLRAGGGDDAILSTVVAELESEGFRVVGSDDLVSALTVPPGPLGRHRPDERSERDIGLGVAVLRALGELDVSQAAVVHQGRVLGIEAAEGTDALLERCRALREDGGGGVLVKLPKPGQERRVDLPTIGSATVEMAAGSGLAGIAIEAGGVLILDREQAVQAADRLGLFVVAVTPDLTR